MKPSLVLKAKRSGGGACLRRFSPSVGGSTGRALGEAIASRRVAPVGAVGGGHPTQVPFFGSMLQMQLAKGLQTPYFEDGDNWADFAWNWGRYWSALTRGGVEVGDEEKLEIFDSCLSAKLRHMTKYLYKGTEKIAFEHVFSILEQRNGQKASQQGRYVWENVSLPLQGKLTLSDLRVFRIDFLDAQRGVPDVGEGEARRHLLAKLPIFLGERIFKKELEKTRTSKKVHVNPGQPVSVSDMRSYIREWTRTSPFDVQSKGDGGFEVLMPNEESAERLLALNCTEIENSEQLLQVKKMPVQFSVVDIFDLLEEQLGEAEDLEAAFPRGGES